MSRFFAIIGAIWATVFLVKLLRFIYIYTRPSSLERYHHNNGDNPPWALVTGASDGIGLGYAHELAHRGFSVILHGRNPTKLENLKTQLSKTYPGVSFRTVIADAFQSGPETLKQIDAIVDSLQDIHLTILINNVGGSPVKPMYVTFERDPPANIDGLINLNSRFQVQLTSAVLPLLLRHKGPGLILNMGSMAAFGTPWLSIYSASKAFDMTWSQSLAREMKAEGRKIEVLGIQTGKVTSVSHSKTPPTLMEPDARTFAAASLDRAGCGEEVVAGYWPQAIVFCVLGALPLSLTTNFMASTIRDLAKELAKKE